MNCQRCGAANEAGARFCNRCGEALQGQAAGGGVGGGPAMRPAMTPTHMPLQMPNYLVHAILVTFFCCMPFGVVALVYATQVNGHLYAGNLRAAAECSQKARFWCGVGFWLAVLQVVLMLILLGFGLAAGSM